MADPHGVCRHDTQARGWRQGSAGGTMSDDPGGMVMRTTLIIAAALTLGFAPLPRMKAELERLQGSWVSGDLEARFEGDRLTYLRGGRMVTAYRFTLDARANPKRLDLVGIGGGAADGRTYQSIYRLD